jgi:hypothetical protein
MEDIATHLCDVGESVDAIFVRSALAASPFPRLRIVHLLVSHFPIDLENPFAVLQHMIHDRPREGVLGVGVDVHPHDP